MKEEKRHLYRIDPLKVQQKVYDMYPANSVARKMMLKEQKISEFANLVKTVASVPIPETQNMLKRAKHSALVHFLIGAVASCGSLICFFATITAKTSMEIWFTHGGFVLCTAIAIYFLGKSILILNGLNKFAEGLEKISDRMETLKKDIFQ